MMSTCDLLWSLSAKFLLAIVLAGAVGLERQRKGRAAGLRTHIMVCLGSALCMIVSDLVAAQWAVSGQPVWLDRGRIAAGVITGIGFLGAGTIMHVGSTQQGLTTAAMIWFTAALGIAIGLGYYTVAIVATAYALFVVIASSWLPEPLQPRTRLALTITMLGGNDQIDSIEKFIHDQGMHVQASRIKIDEDKTTLDITVDTGSTADLKIEHLAQQLQQKFPSAHRIVFER